MLDCLWSWAGHGLGEDLGLGDDIIQERTWPGGGHGFGKDMGWERHGSGEDMDLART